MSSKHQEKWIKRQFNYRDGSVAPGLLLSTLVRGGEHWRSRCSGRSVEAKKVSGMRKGSDYSFVREKSEFVLNKVQHGELAEVLEERGDGAMRAGGVLYVKKRSAHVEVCWEVWKIISRNYCCCSLERDAGVIESFCCREEEWRAETNNGPEVQRSRNVFFVMLLMWGVGYMPRLTQWGVVTLLRMTFRSSAKDLRAAIFMSVTKYIWRKVVLCLLFELLMYKWWQNWTLQRLVIGL